MTRIFQNVEKDDEVVIVLTKEEARALDAVLAAAVHWADDKKAEPKRISKRSKAYKVANYISDLLPIW